MLETGEIYHLLNRGVESRSVFQNKRDYQRFLITLLECNNKDFSPENRHRRCKDELPKIANQQPLVEITCLCLMPNHFHIMARQLVDNGIAKFMQRVGNSYTKYFNIKNERKGSLFMSRYKSVHVKTDSQARHLITYIHANPLDLLDKSWREGKVKSSKKVKDFLDDYLWSSYTRYANGKGVSLISQIIKPEITEMFYTPKDHLKEIKSWANRTCSTLNVEQMEKYE